MTIRTAFPNFPDRAALVADIGRVLKSGRLMNGPYGEEFERLFAGYCGARYAVAVNSCTTALEICLRHVGVEKGEVIVPTNTFIATPNAVIFAGGTPVLADIAPGTYCLAPEAVERLLKASTRAVIVVHIAGWVHPHVEAIRALCHRRRVPLIEDCAHASGARFAGRHAGTFGLAGCFSFYPTKNITTGTGGMIITDDANLAAYARTVRLHGAGRSLGDIVELGNDWFLDEVRACLGVHQLRHLDRFVEHRRRIAALYDRLIAGHESITKFAVRETCHHAYYKYPVQLSCSRRACQHLREIFPAHEGFELESLYWPTCHLQPLYRRRQGYHRGDFPVAEDALSRQVCLPIHSRISVADARLVFAALCRQLAAWRDVCE